MKNKKYSDMVEVAFSPYREYLSETLSEGKLKKKKSVKDDVNDSISYSPYRSTIIEETEIVDEYEDTTEKECNEDIFSPYRTTILNEKKSL